jgi:HD-GYP domain-containing protein (c-di-GMP phosphodiesterase class II)
MLSYTALGAIGGTLGATLRELETIVLLPVFFVTYLIGQLAFQSFADLRQAHDSTVRGCIKTLEAKDMFVHGHTARAASFANMIARELGLNPSRIEQIRWAALMHDVGAVAVPRDLLRNRISLTDEEQTQLLANMENVERELLESDFLRPMMERAARLRMRFSEAPKDEITADAQILAVAKWFDSVTNTRVQGQALTQEKALSQLRAESPYRYDPRVVEAFAWALDASGFEYGALDFDNSRTAEDYAKEAMYDR